MTLISIWVGGILFLDFSTYPLMHIFPLLVLSSTSQDISMSDSGIVLGFYVSLPPGCSGLSIFPLGARFFSQTFPIFFLLRSSRRIFVFHSSDYYLSYEKILKPLFLYVQPNIHFPRRFNQNMTWTWGVLGLRKVFSHWIYWIVILSKSSFVLLINLSRLA